MNVLFATPECAPLAKTGGLGDVSAALPAALRSLGLDARVLLPGYPAVMASLASPREIGRIRVFTQHAVRLVESHLPTGTPLIALDCPELYARVGGPYQREDGHDWEDNPVRFGVLSKIAAILGTGGLPGAWRPDVVHCNDWQASLAPLYLRHSAAPHAAASLVTIHNLAFQGNYSYEQVVGIDLPPSSLGVDGAEFYGQVSFLKGGLMYSDAITTVSPTYAREIQSEELGFGMDGVLRHRGSALSGVRNGIDTTLWDPQTDSHLAKNYSAATLDAKLPNKRALKARLHLQGDDRIPLVALVSRLTHQKGIDVLAQAAHALAALPAQVVVLGMGDREMIGALQAARSRHPRDMSVTIGFDEDLAHLIEAGADIFLMPSRFEPCGMNQMYSQRYGTIPVAHRTGGLADTIIDGETGFLIPEVTSAALLAGVKRAIAAYGDPATWRAMQVRAMAQDFGWHGAAREYLSIYRRITPTSSAPSRSGA